LNILFVLLASDLVSIKLRFIYLFILLIGPVKTIIDAYSNNFILNEKIRAQIDASNETNSTNTMLLATNLNNQTHEDHNHAHEHHNEPAKFISFLYYIVINADPILSISLSFIYLFYFVHVLKCACLFLSQAVPVFVDIDQIKKEIKEFVSYKLLRIVSQAR
jgi:hypothetical protein